MRTALVVAGLFALTALTPFASASLLSPVTSALGAPSDLIVGAAVGVPMDRVAALIAPLGKVVSQVDALSLLEVETSDAVRLTSTLTTSGLVSFVEANGATGETGAQWNGAEWNGAQWNGAEWNGAEWNGVEWNGFTGAPSDPGMVWQWGLAAIDAPAAWGVDEGHHRATLCVLDSGIDASHPDLAANIGGAGFNAIDGSASTNDDGGHGTHMAGVAAAVLRNSYGVAGVGNISLLAVKVLDKTGHGKNMDLARGIAWCAQHGASVALMALSVTGATKAIDRALGYASEHDVLLVASAGNGGPCASCVAYPASDPRVIAVSATSRTGALAPFSAAGSQVELAAPGVDILSTFPSARFVYGSGTSQAAAFVAGAAALVRDTATGLTADQTRAVLDRTATDLGAPGRDPMFGNGLVNVGAAVAASR